MNENYYYGWKRPTYTAAETYLSIDDFAVGVIQPAAQALATTIDQGVYNQLIGRLGQAQTGYGAMAAQHRESREQAQAAQRQAQYYQGLAMAGSVMAGSALAMNEYTPANLPAFSNSPMTAEQIQAYEIVSNMSMPEYIKWRNGDFTVKLPEEKKEVEWVIPKELFKIE
jgi:hypothetical protein